MPGAIGTLNVCLSAWMDGATCIAEEYWQRMGILVRDGSKISLLHEYRDNKFTKNQIIHNGALTRAVHFFYSERIFYSRIYERYEGFSVK
jgi:hypothetical protein